MKKLISNFIITVLCLLMFCSCDGNDASETESVGDKDNTSSVAAEWYDEYATRAVEKLKERWREIYTADDIKDGLLEIKNTRVIMVKENDTEAFKNYECVVLFQIATEKDASNKGYYKTVVFYNDEQAWCVKYDPFGVYTLETGSTDYSAIIFKEQDLKDKYNDGFVLEPGVKEGVVIEGTMSKNADFRIQDIVGNTIIMSSDIKKISVSYTNNSGYVLNIEMTEEGAKKFQVATAENIGKQLPIYIDDTLISSPTINEVITDGIAMISGNFDYASVMRMYYILTE